MKLLGGPPPPLMLRFFSLLWLYTMLIVMFPVIVRVLSLPLEALLRSHCAPLSSTDESCLSLIHVILASFLAMINASNLRQAHFPTQTTPPADLLTSGYAMFRLREMAGALLSRRDCPLGS